MTQSGSYQDSSSDVGQHIFSFYEMLRKMQRWLYGITILAVFVSSSFLMTSFSAETFTDNTDQNYMGLDGEVSAFPISCSTCAVVGQSDSKILEIWKHQKYDNCVCRNKIQINGEVTIEEWHYQVSEDVLKGHLERKAASEGHLLDQEYGSEIDRASCVFRLGFSPNRGMEHLVGARTTARIVDSFSFFPFLKRPWKLVTGPFASETWVLFHRRAGDISWFHKPHLSNLVRKHDSKFLWMTKKAEEEVQQYLRDKTSNIRIQRISSLWFALRVIEDARCKSLKVYGIPDHQICKRNMKVDIPSLYWDNSSVPLCIDGIDASFWSDQNLSPVVNLPTVSERKILLQWTPRHLTSLHFQVPEWPS